MNNDLDPVSMQLDRVECADRHRVMSAIMRVQEVSVPFAELLGGYNEANGTDISVANLNSIYRRKMPDLNKGTTLQDISSFIQNSVSYIDLCIGEVGVNLATEGPNLIEALAHDNLDMPAIARMKAAVHQLQQLMVANAHELIMSQLPDDVLLTGGADRSAEDAPDYWQNVILSGTAEQLILNVLQLKQPNRRKALSQIIARAAMAAEQSVEAFGSQFSYSISAQALLKRARTETQLREVLRKCHEVVNAAAINKSS